MPAETATSSPTPPSSDGGNRIPPGLALVGIAIGVLMLCGDHAYGVVVEGSFSADPVRMVLQYGGMTVIGISLIALGWRD